MRAAKTVRTTCAVAALAVLASAGSVLAATVPMRAGTPDAPSAPAPGAASISRGKVLETMDAGNYTYARVETASGEVWIAGPQTPLKVGDPVAWPTGMQMKSFESKTLGRTFESIQFVDRIDTPAAAESAHSMISKGNSDEPAVTGIAKADGGKTVAEIFDGRDALSGKEVTVRVKVVKANSGIMQRNWLHVRDGSKGAKGENDLTVTTSDTAKVGDIVLIRGAVTLNKDFGFGYRYDVIVEGAKVTVETPPQAAGVAPAR